LVFGGSFAGEFPRVCSPIHGSWRGTTLSGASERLLRGIIVPLDDDDITTSTGGGEGTADGGSNPEGHDGGADGTASEGQPEGGETAGEGPADGGSNPGGHDGGADGTA
jgi:hypothetical protein